MCTLVLSPISNTHSRFLEYLPTDGREESSEMSELCCAVNSSLGENKHSFSRGRVYYVALVCEELTIQTGLEFTVLLLPLLPNAGIEGLSHHICWVKTFSTV